MSVVRPCGSITVSDSPQTATTTTTTSTELPVARVSATRTGGTGEGEVALTANVVARSGALVSAIVVTGTRESDAAVVGPAAGDAVTVSPLSVEDVGTAAVHGLDGQLYAADGCSNAGVDDTHGVLCVAAVTDSDSIVDSAGLVLSGVGAAVGTLRPTADTPAMDVDTELGQCVLRSECDAECVCDSGGCTMVPVVV